MPSRVRWHRVRVGLVAALLIIFAGVVIDSLFSASWVLDDALLLAAAGSHYFGTPPDTRSRPYRVARRDGVPSPYHSGAHLRLSGSGGPARIRQPPAERHTNAVGLVQPARLQLALLDPQACREIGIVATHLVNTAPATNR